MTVSWSGETTSDAVYPAVYPRMLTFPCLATVALTFMMAMVAAKERRLFLLERGKEMAGDGPVVLRILLPVGMPTGSGYGRDFQFATLLIVYFAPILSRLIFNTPQQSVLAAVNQGFFFCLPSHRHRHCLCPGTFRVGSAYL